MTLRRAVAGVRNRGAPRQGDVADPVFKIKGDPRITPVGKWMRLDVQILLRTVPVVLTARRAHWRCSARSPRRVFAPTDLRHILSIIKAVNNYE